MAADERARPVDLAPEPARRLPPAARGLWRATGALAGGPAVLAALTVGPQLPDPVGTLAVVVAVLGALGAVLVWPEVRYRRWRYEVRDDELDIRHGVLVVRRTLVPIRRIQHVETEAGPLADAFGLAAVRVWTAAGKTEIPALTAVEADAVRSRIAALTRTRDDV